MRLLFLSGTTVGGSGRSQRELATQLETFGHEVRFVVDDGRSARATRWLYEQAADAAARWVQRPGAQMVTWIEQIIGRRVRSVVIDDRVSLASPVPQNAVSEVIRNWAPDIVVVSSVERLAWRRAHRTCRRLGVPTVLYVREDDSLAHLALGEVPDLLVANAESLAERLRADGFECTFIPSVIDVDVTRTESTRRIALTINPIASRGVDLVWQLADRLPDVQFVMQESWPLSADELASVRLGVEQRENVEFRRSAPPGPTLYADCRVLLVPYRVDNRPRVISEVHANGIPVVAADVPALREAIGPGGLVVDADDVEAWAQAIDRLWVDDRYYQTLSHAAATHSSRPEIDPVTVARGFENLLLLMAAT